MIPDKLQKPMYRLTIFFNLCIVSFVVLLALSAVSPSRDTSGGLWSVCLGIVVLTWISSGIAFYVYLAELASLLGKSPIVWAGLSFITSPIGPFVAYFNMRRLVAQTTSLPSR